MSEIQHINFLQDLLTKATEENKKLKSHIIHTKKKWIRQGETQEQQRIIKLAKKRICFNNEVGCEHSACYSLSQLIEKIEGKQDE